MGTGITRFHQGSGFHGNREKTAFRGITLLEVGFFSYSVYFLYKSHSMASLWFWFRDCCLELVNGFVLFDSMGLCCCTMLYDCVV